MYETDISIRLHQTDAAGVLFFGNYFHVAHDVYEQYMQSIGFDFRSIINELPYLILIVHAECDFHKPVYVADVVRVAMSASKIGHTSFELVYRIKSSETGGEAELKTTHVAIDKQTGRPTRLPEKLKAELGKLQ
ncbi:MAG: acyl-CoA thioesterase [candidate division Zixibacteria bacterium]|nr:acyl-CoA thioesterase [candidate division Zixibacteria bacterium]